MRTTPRRTFAFVAVAWFAISIATIVFVLLSDTLRWGEFPWWLTAGLMAPWLPIGLPLTAVLAKVVRVWPTGPIGVWLGLVVAAFIAAANSLFWAALLTRVSVAVRRRPGAIWPIAPSTRRLFKRVAVIWYLISVVALGIYVTISLVTWLSPGHTIDWPHWTWFVLSAPSWPIGWPLAVVLFVRLGGPSSGPLWLMMAPIAIGAVPNSLLWAAVLTGAYTVARHYRDRITQQRPLPPSPTEAWSRLRSRLPFKRWSARTVVLTPGWTFVLAALAWLYAGTNLYVAYVGLFADPGPRFWPRAPSWLPRAVVARATVPVLWPIGLPVMFAVGDLQYPVGQRQADNLARVSGASEYLHRVLLTSSIIGAGANGLLWGTLLAGVHVAIRRWRQRAGQQRAPPDPAAVE